MYMITQVIGMLSMYVFDWYLIEDALANVYNTACNYPGLSLTYVTLAIGTYTKKMTFVLLD